MPEMLQLAPEITVPTPEDGALLRFDSDAVEQVRGFFSLLVFGQNEWAGKPFTLTQWEDTGIREFYGIQVQDMDAAGCGTGDSFMRRSRRRTERASLRPASDCTTC